MIGEVAPSLPAPSTEGQVIMKPSEEGVAHSTGRSRTSRLPAAPSPLPENQFYRRKEGRQEEAKADHWRQIWCGVCGGSW